MCKESETVLFAFSIYREHLWHDYINKWINRSSEVGGDKEKVNNLGKWAWWHK